MPTALWGNHSVPESSGRFSTTEQDVPSTIKKAAPEGAAFIRSEQGQNLVVIDWLAACRRGWILRQMES